MPHHLATDVADHQKFSLGCMFSQIVVDTFFAGVLTMQGECGAWQGYACLADVSLHLLEVPKAGQLVDQVCRHRDLYSQPRYHSVSLGMSVVEASSGKALTVSTSSSSSSSRISVCGHRSQRLSTSLHSLSSTHSTPASLRPFSLIVHGVFAAACTSSRS